MSIMSLTSFFEFLGAPLSNSRWSWGSRRASDGGVFLRVWRDHLLFADGGRRYMMVDANVPVTGRNLGYEERVRHIDAIRAGAPCFLVMCDAKDVHSPNRTIKEFDEGMILVGGGIVEKNGKTYVEVVARKPVREVASGPGGLGSCI